jgi:HlyD family secretion protein
MNSNGNIKYFYAAFIVVIVSLIVITLRLKSEATQFAGIADAKEIVVNVQSAVELKEIRVSPGQIVKEGDTLAEVSNVGFNNQEIDTRIAVLAHEIEEYKARKNAFSKLSISERRQQKLEIEDRKAEIKSELQELESLYEVNQSLLSDLKSINKELANAENKSSAKKNPIVSKIEFLKKELKRIDDSSLITMSRARDELSLDGDPITEQIKQREVELTLLQDAKKEFFITAKISGVIGSVAYKSGEKANEFDTIMTLHATAPSFVRGFIHENTYSKVYVGQKVQVTSQDVKKVKISGEVIGVGSRIVEYPVRLRKYPEMIMWGREVQIKIPDVNKLLLGERVMITPIEG